MLGAASSVSERGIDEPWELGTHPGSVLRIPGAEGAAAHHQPYQQQLDADKNAKCEYLRRQQRQVRAPVQAATTTAAAEGPAPTAAATPMGAGPVGDGHYFAEAAKLPATGREENPHHVFIPNNVITAEAIAFEVNVTQPIPPEMFHHLVASNAMICNGVNPGTVSTIKADIPGHLIASVFLGGKMLEKRIVDLPKWLQETLDRKGPEGWCKVLCPPAAPMPTVPASLSPTPKIPMTYQGPTILVIQVRDTSACAKLLTRELYIKSDVAAFSIIAPETTQNLWVASILECSNDGDSTIVAEQLRLQAITYMVTNAMFAVTIQCTLPPSISLKATLFALALSADPIWNAQMGAFVLYVKPSTINIVHWQGITDLVSRQTFRSAYYEYKPHSHKHLFNEN
ncbi:hypothetical protein B0H17DRAFT_1140672 [Mycena rosella]|uniref:Uncharacterized protein n=1 Tax=Mycena rosella TaxID=1033263 RepID=A0AAD7G750_MYCRO|nr:hypothetical protein B0H17DRAFT_1140672 [Mycena rosella]